MSRESKKTIEYTGRVLLGGTLELPASVRRELQLRPHVQVQVTLTCAKKEDDLELAAERAEAWRQVDEVRALFFSMNFSLTDAVLETRREKDATL